MIDVIEAKHLNHNACMPLELTDTNVKRTFLFCVSLPLELTDINVKRMFLFCVSILTQKRNIRNTYYRSSETMDKHN